MILVDANILIYAYNRKAPQHSAARTWLDEQIKQVPRVGMPWFSLIAFLRLVTNPRVFQEAVPVANAWSQVESWLSADSVWTPVPGGRYRSVLATCLKVPGLQANDMPDAHLAALALEHGLTLASNDNGFARFPDLKWMNPLRVS